MRIENSFIPVEGVGERTEREIWRRGARHWDEFDGHGVGPTLAGRIESFVEVARDRLDRGESRYFGEVFHPSSHWRLYENFRSGACFLDIETTGFRPGRDVVTVVGVHRAGETTTLVRGRDLDSSSLRRALRDASLLVTFNGRCFDVPCLERSFDVDLGLPHLDLRYPCRQLGYDGGLKSVERAIGVERTRPDLSGRGAVRLWRAHERGDTSALETLLAYNREDVRNLAPIADRVTRALHERVFESAVDPSTERA